MHVVTSLCLNGVNLTLAQSRQIYDVARGAQDRIIQDAGEELYVASADQPDPANPADWGRADADLALRRIEALATDWLNLAVIATAAHVCDDMVRPLPTPAGRADYDDLVRAAACRRASRAADAGEHLSRDQRALLQEHWSREL